MSADQAKTLIAQGDELFDAGRHEEAFTTFDEVVDRFGDSTDNDAREQVALALLRKGWDLARLKRDEEAVVVYDAAAARFPDAEDNAVGVNVVQALLNRGNSLRRLERSEEALAAYNDVTARFGSCARPGIRRRVTWVLWNATNALDDLGRSGEAEPLYDAIVARSDDDFAPNFRGNLAWCLEHIADRSESSYKEQFRLFTELAERFRDATDLRTLRRVSRAMRMRAWIKGQLGLHDEEITLYEEAAAAFATADDAELRLAVVDALRREARAMGIAGRVDEALPIADRALELADEADTTECRREAAAVLAWKGDELYKARRFEEAGIVFDSAIAAYRQLSDEADEDSLADATCAIANAASVYAMLRSPALTETATRIAALLGDVEDEPLEPKTSVRPPDAEDELAASLAETLGGECWLAFTAGDRDESARTDFARTAVDIYRHTEALVPSDTEEWDTPAFAAAIMLRSVADGYAMLSAPYDEQDRARLPLPSRPVAEWGIRLLGLDTWAEEHGHPLPLREEEDVVEKLLDEERTRVLENSNDELESNGYKLALVFGTLAAQYDLCELLCRSPRGRSVRGDARLTSFAVWHVVNARRCVTWSRDQSTESQGAAAAMALMAQGVFVATHADEVDAAELFPGRSILRELVHAHRSYDWLVDQGVPLPVWLLPEDGDEP